MVYVSLQQKFTNLWKSFLCTAILCFGFLSALAAYGGLSGIPVLYVAQLSEEDIREQRIHKLYGGYVNLTVPTPDILLNITHDPYFDKQIDDLSLEPIPFLPTYKSPCWFESLPEDAVYSRNIWAKLKPREYGTVLRTMPKLLRDRKYHDFGWRLRCLPYFYVPGVSKCGTTDLYSALLQHPDVVPAPLKEPAFWNRIRLNESVNNPDDLANKLYHELPRIKSVPVPRPTKDYIELYDMASESIRREYTNKESPTGQTFQFHQKITMDSTPSYFYEYDGWTKLDVNQGLSEPKYTTPDLIYKLNPRTKIVLMFRNPTERLFSDYKFFSRRGTADIFHTRAAIGIQKMDRCLSNRTVRSCIYDKKLCDHHMQVRIRVGMYQPYLEDWLRVFPRENVFIARLEDYGSGPQKVLDKLASFLGLEEGSLRKMKKVTNKSQPSRGLRQGMLNATRVMVNNFYRKWNHLLADMLDDSRYTWGL